MGVIPLQFPAGTNAESLGLDGTEEFTIEGISALNSGTVPATLRVVANPTTHSDASKKPVTFDAPVRIDTPAEADYYRNGGILQYVLRSLL
jgi:aconitate hydratase